MKNKKLQKMVLTSLFMAMVTVSTMSITIPTPGQGYIHLGDTLVYLSGIFLGPLYGVIAAGIGSMFADIFVGYASWALPTLIIKSLDALAFGIIFKNAILDSNNKNRNIIKFVIALSIGGSIMVGGYLITGTIFYGFPGAVTSIVPNIIQSIGGGIIAYPIFIALSKVNKMKEFEK